MKTTRFSACLAALAATALLEAGVASAAAGPRASCMGIAVSSAAGQPGLVADLTRQFHQEAKDAGIPPGAGDASFAKFHEGSLEACLTPA